MYVQYKYGYDTQERRSLRYGTVPVQLYLVFFLSRERQNKKIFREKIKKLMDQKSIVHYGYGAGTVPVPYRLFFLQLVHTYVRTNAHINNIDILLSQFIEEIMIML